MEHLPIGNVKHSYVYYTVKSFTFKEPPPPSGPYRGPKAGSYGRQVKIEIC